MTVAVRLTPATPAFKRAKPARRRLHDAVDGKIYFAQVREDPLLEMDALDPKPGGTYVVVGSGGCTALSLLARGAGRVVAVDMNATQNHVTELKAAAVSSFDPAEATAFLGGWPLDSSVRRALYRELRAHLTGPAREYWDHHDSEIATGVLGCGVSERFIEMLARVVKTVIHPSERIKRLLGSESIEEQAHLYSTEWNNRRWRALFGLLLNRWTMSRTYEPAFFAHVESRSFAAHFHDVFERTVTDVPVATNYFLHHMLTGAYPSSTDGALPPYLDPANAAIALDRLELVDGSLQEYLSTCDADSVDGIALSNICEWLSEGEIGRLFNSVARVAKPGAPVCFRNFVGHTEVPAGMAHIIVEDRAAGAIAIARDRSCVQARIALCRVNKAQ